MAYQKTGSILSVAGMDVSRPAEYISERNTPNCQNMMVNRSILRKRYGLTLVGDQIAGTSKEIMAGRQFTREGINYVVRIGLDKIEEWNDVTEVWDDITGSDLTGTTSDTIDTATPLISGLRILTFTNNVDNIRKYTGTGNTADLGGSPPKCKYMIEYGSYLVLANVTSGNAYGMRVQWCDTGDPEDWSTGNAGSQDLIEDGKDITGLGGFGNYIAVHKESCIYLGYLVSTSSIFKFDRKNTGAGTICHATIQSLPTGEQAFLATDGIRVFNGISAPLIESPITDELREGVNPEYVHKCWSIVVPELDEYWVGVPIGSQTTGDTVYKYNYITKTVHKDTRSNITAAWKYTQVTQLSWDDITTAWDAYTGRWDDTTLAKLFPLVMLADNTGYTYKRDVGVNDDNSVAVDAFWESKDFTSEEQGRFCQWVGMELWAKGSAVTVDYSTDSGATWTNITSLTNLRQRLSDR